MPQSRTRFRRDSGIVRSFLVPGAGLWAGGAPCLLPSRWSGGSPTCSCLQARTRGLLSPTWGWPSGSPSTAPTASTSSVPTRAPAHLEPFCQQAPHPRFQPRQLGSSEVRPLSPRVNGSAQPRTAGWDVPQSDQPRRNSVPAAAQGPGLRGLRHRRASAGVTAQAAPRPRGKRERAQGDAVAPRGEAGGGGASRTRPRPREGAPSSALRVAPQEPPPSRSSPEATLCAVRWQSPTGSSCPPGFLHPR